MALALTPTGLSIQTQSEIQAELETSFRAAFGTDVDVSDVSPFGELIGSFSEREALVQQLVLAVYTAWNPISANGVTLDQEAAMTGTTRRAATQSLALTKGLITGVAATVIPDGSQIQNDGTGETWETINGPYVIPGGGTIACDLRALLTGPKVFQAATSWTIITPIAGWTSFSTTADIDPDETGSNIETDEALRIRRAIEILKLGRDAEGIRAVVSALPGVSTVNVFVNNSCAAAFEGIPGGAFETVVQGGDDTAIALAIRDAKPVGSEAFGSTIVPVPNTEGGTIDIGFTRPLSISIFVEITCSTAGAEVPLPQDAAQSVEDAFLAAADLTATVGRDVIPQSFTGVIFDAVRDPVSGQTAFTDVIVGMAIVAVGPFLETPITISLRELADFDSLNTVVIITP